MIIYKNVYITLNILYPMWKYRHKGFLPPPTPPQFPPQPVQAAPAWSGMGGKHLWVYFHI